MSQTRVFKQLKYSIDTLRKYNEDILVKVFVSPPQTAILQDISFNTKNLEFVPFNNLYGNDWPKKWLDDGYAEFLFHRWKNAFESIEKFDFDNILYLDTDTIFYNNPNLLFEKYGNQDIVYGREDNSNHIMDQINMVNGLNDGQFILNKSLVHHKNEFLSFMNSYINNMLEKYKNILNEKDFHDLHWIIVQYSAYEYFSKINKIKYFSNTDVMLSTEPDFLDISNLILHHYYSGNTDRYVPSEYR
jgi:hypothetical protein